MPRGIKLNEKEKGSIEAYRSCGMTIREIAEHLQRSITVVHNYIKMGRTYYSQKRTVAFLKYLERTGGTLFQLQQRKNVWHQKSRCECKKCIFKDMLQPRA